MCSLIQSVVGDGLHFLVHLTNLREADFVPIPNRTLLLYPVKQVKNSKVGIIGTDHSDYLMNRDVA